MPCCRCFFTLSSLIFLILHVGSLRLRLPLPKNPASHRNLAAGFCELRPLSDALFTSGGVTCTHTEQVMSSKYPTRGSSPGTLRLPPLVACWEPAALKETRLASHWPHVCFVSSARRFCSCLELLPAASAATSTGSGRAYLWFLACVLRLPVISDPPAAEADGGWGAPGCGRRCLPRGGIATLLMGEAVTDGTALPEGD